ncbi:hypothetical protein CFH99_15835 [Nocardioides aromaticivorans]|uniref:N-acetyltransferase domain-containing protein n=1 Tax=Nocardioides aromaticivorans TaxID=200618 RepID=A0ABX7PMZ2_9ACTN|nr:GNAT family N-acetyltransferase [Nocardioides aromaticivorans]QSR27097.1 hypothetical protein CFH99_15835 [Nocardioides aromaticivorans]
MSSLLSWRNAAPGDRQALQSFECTTPGKKIKHAGRWEIQHPRRWELQVQSKIRAHVKPPCRRPNHCLVGWDGDNLAAVVFYEELDGPAQIEVHVVAVSMAYRRRGGGWADELLRMTLDDITATAIEQGVDITSIVAWIDEGNRPSQDLFRRTGFRQVGVLEGSTLQRWALTLQIRGVEIDESF